MSVSDSDSDLQKRRRLSPERRKAELLDAAINLILEEGVSGLTMQKIADRAGVSKGLIYAYFANTREVLGQVYRREHEKVQSQQLEALQTTLRFEDLVRVSWRIKENSREKLQMLSSRLAADVTLQDSLEAVDRKTQRDVVAYLQKEIRRHYDIPREIAERAIRLVLDYEDDPSIEDGKNTQDDIWGGIVVGAMKELEARHGKRGLEDEDE